MANINRRDFLALLAGVAASQVIPSFAFGDERDDAEGEKILVTESVALAMGKRFFDAIAPAEELTMADAHPIFDKNGKGTAFIVHAISGDESYGYVIFDSKENLGISEFSFGTGTPSPYQSASNSLSSSRSLGRPGTLHQADPLTYCVLSDDLSTCCDNYGRMGSPSSMGIVLPSESVSRSPKPDQWTDANVLLDLAEVYRSYNISDANSVSGYTTITQSSVESVACKYACAVSAMRCVASYYVTVGDLVSEYNELWNSSDTQVVNTSGCVSYGSTLTVDIGPALAGFCAARGRNLNYSYEADADWLRYYDCINSGNMAIFSAELAARPGSGHSMAVAGHMTLSNKNDILDFMHALMVNDGWSDGLRILNHNVSHYSWHDGVFLS